MGDGQGRGYILVAAAILCCLWWLQPSGEVDFEPVEVGRTHKTPPLVSTVDLSLIVAPNDLDAVIVAAYDDREALIYHAIPSLFTNVNDLRYCFIVCQQSLCDLLQDMMSGPDKKLPIPVDRLYIIPETVYPFTYSTLKRFREDHGIKNDPMDGKDRHGWTFQQLLKLFALPVLGRGRDEAIIGKDVLGKPIPVLRDTILIADGDTTWLQPTDFAAFARVGMPQCYISVASTESGAFNNDVLYGQDGVKFLLGSDAVYWPDTISPLTAITHHSVFQYDLIQSMMRQIQLRAALSHDRSSMEVWQLIGTTLPWLSEYTLYLAWAMHKRPTRVILRALPYINSGANAFAANNVDDSRARWKMRPAAQGGVLDAKTSPNLVYVSAHDDYAPNGRCCVNTLPHGFPCGPCDTAGDLAKAVGPLNDCAAAQQTHRGEHHWEIFTKCLARKK